MANFIWIGAAVAMLGLAGLVYCIVAAARARSAGLDDAALRERLRPLVAWNLGALLVSISGLMLVVIGILLG